MQIKSYKIFPSVNMPWFKGIVPDILISTLLKNEDDKKIIFKKTNERKLNLDDSFF
jgi:hypothetical protein